MNKTLLNNELKVREWNFELLRIVSMFMVLVLHAASQALGYATRADIISTPLLSSLKMFFVMMSVVAVNVFILISGWFGIKSTLRGGAKFIFQCLFFSIGIYVVMILLGYSSLTIRGVAECFFLLPNGYYWFIPSYLALYIVAPVLNAFIRTADKKTFMFVLITFYAFQTVYSFLGNGASFLMKGYSALSFIGLYLLAAYIKHNYNVKKKDKKIFLMCYCSISLLSTIIWLSATYYNLTSISSRMTCYSNPLVIISSVSLMLFFSTLRVKSRIINKIAVSCFAAYLLHQNSHLVEYYAWSVQYAENNFPAAIGVIGVICGWFLLSILIDQSRIYLYNLINKIFIPKS